MTINSWNIARHSVTRLNGSLIAVGNRNLRNFSSFREQYRLQFGLNKCTRFLYRAKNQVDICRIPGLNEPLRFSVFTHRVTAKYGALTIMPYGRDMFYPGMGCLMATQVAQSKNTVDDVYDNILGTQILSKCPLPLAPKVFAYVEECVKLCKPDGIYICDGSDVENTTMLELLQKSGAIKRLPKYDNCWLARTNPADVARVESRTFISTESMNETIPTPRNGVKGTLGNWISPNDMDSAILQRFPGCMKGRTMYVIPFSMGPVDSPLSKIGIEITDSPYVVCSMRIMTRIGSRVLNSLGKNDFVKCLHSVGAPSNNSNIIIDNSWPCDPERTIILHKPAKNEIVSYGSGYGGNSLLGKKCFALRIGSTIAKREGWLAEHMLVTTNTNPNAMKTIFKNTIFTNVASTSDGGVYWEGMENEIDNNVDIFDWHGNPWSKNSKSPAAHPNSRFCTPANQCPIIDPAWEDPEGVPIDAILFGGRRPEGVPLIYQARNWQHGVFIGATMRSEATAAAEHKAKVIMNDPFAMRPFFGYNFGHYLDHWLSMAEVKDAQLPKIFHVNWFRKGPDNKFLWPGFGENSRVLDWILRRIDNEDNAVDTAIGLIPKENSLNLNGVGDINVAELFRLPKEFWQREVKELREYLDNQVGDDLPQAIKNELENFEKNISKLD
ncbi:hypothetical protein PV327_003443 [Microctonus hyperodae]|uniref:Phosphoenolpyruvate carboxykinase [GTP] n=1 Tax=Microctonus hyperodae TaxID=165561 RepID=A0AA39L171_MICHY|nr:hypothetical protein PV327_003443 [Microctonus hyperodae]